MALYCVHRIQVIRVFRVFWLLILFLDETKELLTILISNRSAVFYELKEYKKVFNDIDYLLEIGSYPAHLEYKIWLRKGKCYLALQNEKSANESFNQALESLQKSKLTQEEINKKISEINSVRTSKFPVASHEIIPISNTNVFIGDNQYISAHPKVNFQQDDVQGRYAIAAEDIEAGTIILEENPHCSVISFEHQLTNCQYCATSTNQPISCPNCAYAIFCTTNCERISNDSFHKIECGFKRELQNAGVSINCCMALRIIAQKPLQFFKQKKKLLKDFFKDSTKKIQPKKKVYRYDDYDNVFFLCRNENSRNKEDLIHFSCMAVFLMRLLKIGEYFGDYQLLQPDGDDLNEDELLIATLILRHLEILQFNAHELSELRNIGKRDRKIVHELDTFYETEAIGAAIYPTLALFNHSCDPSIIRYNIKNRMIARTIKPIKSGEIIYENYGPLYMSMAIEKRQELLLKKYLFECLCVPCVELWPLFNEMNENELRIPCNSTKCPFVFVIYGNEEPFLTCNYCHQVTSILPHLKGLMVKLEIELRFHK